MTSRLVGFLIGVLATYVTFYLRGALARREQIAKSLADFYASAATAYYARKDYEKTGDSSSDRMTFYKLYDEHYREFLSSSTLLASLVPPKLRNNVLNIEDLWEQIGGQDSWVTGREGCKAVAGKEWFEALDDLRSKILNSLRYSQWTDPHWKS